MDPTLVYRYSRFMPFSADFLVFDRWEGMKRAERKMCGIFAYLSYSVNRERRYILEVLFNGLRHLEYRGYDSAGISVDFALPPLDTGASVFTTFSRPLVFCEEGNIESLVRFVYEGFFWSLLLPCSLLLYELL